MTHLFDHLFENIEQRSRWIILYADYLRRVWNMLYLVEAIGIADIVLKQDEQDEHIRFSVSELEHYTTIKLLKIEVERRGGTINPLQYIIKADDHVLFGFNYNGGPADQFIVSKITSMDNRDVLCHFLYGHHSLSEYIKKTDIIGIGLNTATGNGTKILGWTGHYRIFNQHKLETIQKRHETCIT